MVEREGCQSDSKIDDIVKYVFREHNQEADHWANIGAQGQRKIPLDRRNNHEKWKVVKGYWHGSFKDKGKRECGVVIKGADRESWVTISRIAVPSKLISRITVPLKVGTAIAAEVAGVCVRTGILDLVFKKCVFTVSISVLTVFSTSNNV